MIRNSFIFLPRISRAREQCIWQSGIKSWNDFLNAKYVKGISQYRKKEHDRLLLRAKEELLNENSAYFSQILPRTEAWRLYDYFKDDVCFLDIETNGFNGYITVIGMYDGNDTKVMVRNINMDKNILMKELSKYKLLVTFNGSSFDLPVLKRYFGDVIPKIPHIDLRHCCSKIGLKGGLKSIEEQLNISRPQHLKAYGGDNAIDLWRAFLASGDKEYLELLVQYNEQDIINLKPLAEHVYETLCENTYS